RPHLVVLGSFHVTHDVLGAADRGAGQAASHRLGQADDVRYHAEEFGRSARPDGEAGLDLVEGEKGAVATGHRSQPFQIARLGRDDADIHHDRLDDHARDPVALLLEDALQHFDVVERHHQREIDDLTRDPGAGPDTVGPGCGAEVFEVLINGHLHRVVVAVVAPFDL